MGMTWFLFMIMAWCWEGNRETRVEIQCVPLFFHQLTRLWICRTQGFSKTTVHKEWCSSLWPAAGECDQAALFSFMWRLWSATQSFAWNYQENHQVSCSVFQFPPRLSIQSFIWALIRNGFNRTGTAQEVSLLDSIVWVTMGLLWACHKGGIVWTSFVIFL